MRKFLFFVLSLLIFSNCNKSKPDIIANAVKPESLHRKYLLGSTNLNVLTFGNQHYRFTYNNDQFRVRTGGFLTIAPSNGYQTIFIDEVYDTVIYNSTKNIELLTKIDKPGFQLADPFRRVFTLSNGKIQSKVSYSPSFSSAPHDDTTLFYYSSNKRLERTVEYSKNFLTTKIYTYNASGNLQRVSGEVHAKDNNALQYTIQEVFGDYDTASNPLKAFGLWEETFNRSLSENNFRTYTYSKRYAPADFVVDSASRTWSLQYNNDGTVNFSN